MSTNLVLEKTTTGEVCPSDVVVSPPPMPEPVQLALFPDLVPFEQKALAKPAEKGTTPAPVRDPRQLPLFPESDTPEHGGKKQEEQSM